MIIGVTGGSGYLGSILVPKLASRATRVELLDLVPPSLGLISHSTRLTYHHVDISESRFQDLAPHYDLIIHLAALVGYPACEKDPALAERTNVKGTENVMRFKRRDAGVLFASTISCYGDQPEGAVVTEETPSHPNSIYGKTKCLAEKLVMADPNSIVLRFAGSFGRSPNMRHDVLIHDFVSKAAAGEPLSIYESHFTRQFIHVKDMAGAILYAVDHWSDMKGQLYNVGNPRVEITKRDLVDAMTRHHRFEHRYEASGTDLEKRNYRVSFERLEKKGFHPKTGLDEGLKELFDYYRTRKELQHAG